MHKDLVRVSTDISFEIWAALRKEAKRNRMTIRPYLARVLEEFVKEDNSERNATVEEVSEGVEEPISDEFYPED